MPEATPIAHWPKRNESMVHDSIVRAMADTTDTANVIIRPPIAWAVAVLAGLALNWLMPLPFIPAAVPAGELGVMVFALALSLVAWAIVTMTRARLECTHQSADHDNRQYRSLPLHAQSHLPRHGAGPHRLGHCPQQSLAVADAGALRPRHPLWCSRPRGSLSRTQVRRRLSPLPRTCAALAVVLP